MVYCLFIICGAKFACAFPTWRLPGSGHAAALVAEGGVEVGGVRVETGQVSGSVGCGFSGSRKGVRLNRKPPAYLAFRGSLGMEFRPRGWKKLSTLSGVDHAGAKRIREHLDDGIPQLRFPRVGVG